MKTKILLTLVALAIPFLVGSAETVTYDEHNRIMSIDYGSGKSIAYTYDKVGNRKTMVSSGLTAPSPYAANNVPVWWLNKYGFTSDLDAITSLDLDGDGMITADEWEANTDPTSVDSVLKFDEFLVVDAGATVDLRWKTELNRRYTVYESTDLDTWDPVPGCENIDGDGNYIECDLSGLDTSDGKRFFKVEVWKP